MNNEKETEEQHIFNAPDDDKESRFCRCGEYLTHPVHVRAKIENE